MSENKSQKPLMIGIGVSIAMCVVTGALILVGLMN